MSETTSIREEILKDIDEVPADLKATFKEFFYDLPVEEFKASFSDDSVLNKVSAEAFRPLLQEVVTIFWDEVEAEVNDFCQQWKSRVPSEETLTTLSDVELDGILQEFLDELETFLKERSSEFGKRIMRKHE